MFLGHLGMAGCKRFVELPFFSLHHPGGSPKRPAQAKASQLVPGGAEAGLPGERVQGGTVLL